MQLFPLRQDMYRINIAFNSGTAWLLVVIILKLNISNELEIAGMFANSVHQEQTAPQEQSDFGVHCLLWSYCTRTLNY